MGHRILKIIRNCARYSNLLKPSPEPLQKKKKKKKKKNPLLKIKAFSYRGLVCIDRMFQAMAIFYIYKFGHTPTSFFKESLNVIGYGHIW